MEKQAGSMNREEQALLDETRWSFGYFGAGSTLSLRSKRNALYRRRFESEQYREILSPLIDSALLYALISPCIWLTGH